MRSKKYLNLLLIVIGMNPLIISCSKEKDYSSVTYRNYLRYEIIRATAFIAAQSEGTAEGQYLAGSIETYQDEVSQASAVVNDEESSQEEIDQAYKILIKAGDDFYDRMVPFKTGFAALIADAEFAIGNISEGGQEGNAKPGSKSVFQAEIDKAKEILANSALTQRMIDSERVALLNALYLFDSEIIGKANLYVENAGFESPGFNTVDFAVVPGWNLYGKLETWAPKAEIYKGGTSSLPVESVPEGEYVARIGSYTQGIYQQLPEIIHPGVNYELSFKASLLENYPDAFGKNYKTVVRSRLLTFDETPGDYRFVSIISESFDTLGINPGGFIELKQSVEITGASAFVENKMAVDFMIRHTFDSSVPIWAEAYVAIDKITISRKAL